jgi:hypothetical protein
MPHTRLPEESRTYESDLRKSTLKSASQEQVVSQPVHKSDIIQSEAVIYLDDADPKHFTLLIIPKSHILLVWQGNEAREPFLVSSHVS